MTVRLPGYSRKLPRLLVLVLVDLVGHASWLVSSGQGGRGARISAFLLSASADSYRRMPFSRTLGHTKGTSRSCSGGVRDTLYFCTSVVMVWWWCGGGVVAKKHPVKLIGLAMFHDKTSHLQLICMSAVGNPAYRPIMTCLCVKQGRVRVLTLRTAHPYFREGTTTVHRQVHTR